MNLWQRAWDKIKSLDSLFPKEKSKVIKQNYKKAERSELFQRLKSKNEEQILEFINTSTFEIEEVDLVSGLTPLLFAARLRLWAVVERLIEMGADIHVKSYAEKLTVIELALKGRNLRLARDLIERGVHVLNKDNVGRDGQPLVFAVEADAVGLFEWMMGWVHNSGELGLYDDVGLACVLGECAASAKSEGMLRAVMRHKPNLNNGTLLTGNTPMLTVVGRGDLEFARIMLEHGADPNFQFSFYTMAVNGVTPLMLAADRGDLEMVRLLAPVSNLDAVSGETLSFLGGERHERGQTALYYAVKKDHHEVAEFLIDSGHRLDILDEWGFPILGLAIINRSTRMLNLLLPGSPDIAVPTQEDNPSMLDFAKEKFPEIYSYLVANQHKQKCRKQKQS